MYDTGIGMTVTESAWRGSMEIAEKQKQGRVPVTVFELKGRINLGNAEELEKQARAAYNSGTCDMLLDLSEVESLTSAGLRAILSIYKMLGSGELNRSEDKPGKSRHLKLLNPTPYVSKVLHTAGFEQYLEIFTNEEEAIASF
jgi:anti-anti-sigma factor